MASRAEREKRWIVLADDGRHATLGRHSDPSEEELQEAAKGLHAAGVGGWLAVTEGVYYSRDKMSLLMVRELAPSKISFDEASRTFLATRKRTLASYAAKEGPKPG